MPDSGSGRPVSPAQPPLPSSNRRLGPLRCWPLTQGAEDRPCVPVPACSPHLGSQLQRRSPLYYREDPTPQLLGGALPSGAEI